MKFELVKQLLFLLSILRICLLGSCLPNTGQTDVHVCTPMWGVCVCVCGIEVQGLEELDRCVVLLLTR